MLRDFRAIPGASSVPRAKGLSLILLAFFPLAVYLLILGAVNRRRRPVLVWGVWDFVGVLFAASGFLLFGGPAVLSSLNERWRLFWLFGQSGVRTTAADGAWQFWIFLSLLYFALVVGGSAYFLWRHRHLTSIYNAERPQVEQAILQVCAALHLDPVRSGDMFLFGLSAGLATGQRGPPGQVQAPHYAPTAVRTAAREGLEVVPRVAPGPDGAAVDQTAVLELDSFPFMHHVTLRWDPADSPLRQTVEAALARKLAETYTPENELGWWLLVLGFLGLAFECLVVFALILFNLFRR
jgi:hypothetical protein